MPVGNLGATARRRIINRSQTAHHKSRTLKTAGRTLIMTREEWNELDDDARYELVYGSEGHFEYDTDDELENELSRDIGSFPEQLPDFYFEIGPNSLVLHLKKAAFRWIDCVK